MKETSISSNGNHLLIVGQCSEDLLPVVAGLGRLYFQEYQRKRREEKKSSKRGQPMGVGNHHRNTFNNRQTKRYMKLKIKHSPEQIQRLSDALNRAYEAAILKINVADGGSANMDQCVIDLREWPLSEIRELPRIGRKIGYRSWKHNWEVKIPIEGQGARNTAMQEAARNVLCEAGYGASVMYIVD
jgi:hypothetical protein